MRDRDAEEFLKRKRSSVRRASRDAQRIYYDQIDLPLFANGIEAIDYRNNTVEELLDKAARCIYETAMRGHQ